MELCQTLLEAIRYEQWLRFYFMADTEEEFKAEGTDGAEYAEAWDLTAKLDVPPTYADISQSNEPHLYPLLEVLQGVEISLEGSRDAVFRHAANAAGQDYEAPGFGETLFQLVGNPDFRRGLDAFHGWVQDLANGEIEAGLNPDCAAGSVPTFAQWQAAFKEWEAQEAVKHVTTISPFGAHVQLGSGEDLTS